MEISIVRRLTQSFLMIVLPVLFATALISILAIRSVVYHESRLELQALCDSMSENDSILAAFHYPEYADSTARAIGNLTGKRITLIATDGVVIGDSEENPR